jgi:uncharacterized membrane protein
LAVPFIEIGRSLTAHNFVDRAAAVHLQTLAALKWLCWLIAAGLAASPSFRKRVLEDLNGTSKSSSPHLPAAVAAASFTLLLCFLKYCQYRGYQLPEDTAVMAQRAFSASRGHFFRSGIYGVNYFSIHFAFTMDLLAPILWLWRSALALLLLQCLALGSMGAAAYLIAYRRSSSSYVGMISLLLVYSCPAYSQLSIASLNDGVFLAPFLAWALVAWEYERKILCAILLIFAATTREHFPFSLAGLGIYFVFRSGRPTRSNLLGGAAILSGAVFLWIAELKLIGSFPVDANVASYWADLARFYGVPGSRFEEVLPALIRHPWSVFVKCVYPFDRLWPAAGLVVYSAFLPLAAPVEFIPFCVAVLPLMLMTGGIHDLRLHYPSLVFALLIFAAASGAARAYAWLKRRRWEGHLLWPVLLMCGLGFGGSDGVLQPNWRPQMFDVVPGIVEKIPPDASLWVDEWLSAWTACRAQLKPIAFEGFNLAEFSHGLFRPDYVLLQKGWIAGEQPESRDPLILFLAESKYVRVAMAPDLVLLRAPDISPSAGESPAAILPVPTPAQKGAIQNDLDRLWLEYQGYPVPPVKLTDEQLRIERYCDYLLLPNAASP